MVEDSALPWLFGIGANVLHIYWREQRLDRSARQRLRIADELRFADGPEAVHASLPDARTEDGVVGGAGGALPFARDGLHVARAPPHALVLAPVRHVRDDARVCSDVSPRASRVRSRLRRSCAGWHKTALNSTMDYSMKTSTMPPEFFGRVIFVMSHHTLTNNFGSDCHDATATHGSRDRAFGEAE